MEIETDFKEPKSYKIEALPKMPELFIDPTIPVFNQNKHDKTRLKNRKKRKKRKRR
jgi:hypothetical protein